MLRIPRSLARGFATLPSSSKLVLPDLDYDYGALEPHISADIMKLHHSKHHQTYVNVANTSLEQMHEAIEQGHIDKAIQLRNAVLFNGGGHLNHSIFWKNLAPVSAGGGGEPSGELAVAIKNLYGDFASFKTKMAGQTAAVQGSGWGWLVYDPAGKGIKIITTPNQDPVVSVGMVPLLGIDVWEHAYYLQYKNVRPDYLKAIWNVINWKDVEARFAKAIAK